MVKKHFTEKLLNLHFLRVKETLLKTPSSNFNNFSEIQISNFAIWTTCSTNKWSKKKIDWVTRILIITTIFVFLFHFHVFPGNSFFLNSYWIILILFAYSYCFCKLLKFLFFFNKMLFKFKNFFFFVKPDFSLLVDLFWNAALKCNLLIFFDRVIELDHEIIKNSWRIFS